MSGGPAFMRVRAALGQRVTGEGAGHLDAKCPAHEDQNPSLSVDERRGAVYLNCHAGCKGADIARAIGLSMRDLYDQPRESTGGPHVVAEYDYTDEAGACLYQKRRFAPKDFRIRYVTPGGWVHRSGEVLGGVRWVLFRLPAVRAAIATGTRIFVVEGEKDVGTLERLGLTATCNTHGAATSSQRPKWTAAESKQLDGARDVIVIPDNDDAGEAHAAAIVRSLGALPNPPVVRVLHLPNLPAHGDVSDWVEKGGTKAGLFALIDATPQASVADASPRAETASVASDGRAGRLMLKRAADVSPEPVTWLWPGWLPHGKLVSLDGTAGIGKSTLVIDLIARASRGGPMPNSETTFAPAHVLIGGVEDGWADTIRPRLDAANADLTRVHFVTTKSGQTLTIPRDVVELIEKAKALGASWLHIDAIMGVLDEDVSANSDHEVRRALGSLKDAASDAGILVTFVRHPRKAGGLAVHAGGGSVAFTALCRVGLFVGLEPGEETDQNARRRVLAVGKSNLAKHPAPLAFTVESSPNGQGCIAWHGAVSVTADELASPAPPPATQRAPQRERPDPYAREKSWLREQMPAGERMKLDALKAAAERAGIPWHRVKRAGSDAGVSITRDGFPACSYWYFPTLQSAQLEQLEHSPDTLENAVPTVPTGDETEPALFGSPSLVRVTWKNGEQIDLPEHHPDIATLRHLIERIDPLGEAA